MEERVLKVLSEEFPDIDFTSSDALVDDGIASMVERLS